MPSAKEWFNRKCGITARDPNLPPARPISTPGNATVLGRNRPPTLSVTPPLIPLYPFHRSAIRDHPRQKRALARGSGLHPTAAKTRLSGRANCPVLTGMPPEVSIRVLCAADYSSVVHLWQQSDGVEVAEGDDEDSIAGYLRRNPNLSRVAVEGDDVVGAVLCGHDGRRGLIYHLAVRPDYRGQGLGKRLVEECITGLRACGIRRALILVARDNPSGRDFWAARGFEEISGASPMGLDL